jgi:hypothetical protein
MGILGSIFGGNAQKKAAKQNIRLFTDSRNDSLRALDPFTKNAGADYNYFRDALGAGDTGAAISRFEASPEYQLNFNRALDEGRQAVGAVGQATGTYNSGRTLKALQDRATDTSRGFFSDYLKGLSGVSDRGYGATGDANATRLGYSQLIAGGNQAKADAKTSQYAGFDNILSGGLKFLGGFL